MSARPEDIPALEAEVSRIRKLLHEAEDILRDARIANAPFKEGDVIEMNMARRTGESDWQEVIVREVYVSYSSTSYRVCLRKKNGDWSNAPRSVYSDRQLRAKVTS